MNFLILKENVHSLLENDIKNYTFYKNNQIKYNQIINEFKFNFSEIYIFLEFELFTSKHNSHPILTLINIHISLLFDYIKYNHDVNIIYKKISCIYELFNIYFLLINKNNIDIYQLSINFYINFLRLSYILTQNNFYHKKIIDNYI